MPFLIIQTAGMLAAFVLLMLTCGVPRDGFRDVLGTIVLTVLWPVPIGFLLLGMSEGALKRLRARGRR